MKLLTIKVDCPTCGTKIKIPDFARIEAKALKDYDLAEQAAQDKLRDLQIWLSKASLWDVIKWWFKGKRSYH